MLHSPDATNINTTPLLLNACTDAIPCGAPSCRSGTFFNLHFSSVFRRTCGASMHSYSRFKSDFFISFEAQTSARPAIDFFRTQHYLSQSHLKLLCLSRNKQAFAEESFLANASSTKSPGFGNFSTRLISDATIFCSGCSIHLQPLLFNSFPLTTFPTETCSTLLTTFKNPGCTLAEYPTPCTL